jgi:hypothetical protein
VCIAVCATELCGICMLFNLRVLQALHDDWLCTALYQALPKVLMLRLCSCNNKSYAVGEAL